MKSYNNFASNLSYFAQFSFQNEILKFYLQSVKLPDTLVGVVNTYRHGVMVPVQGDSREYTSVPLSFILDEDFEVYDILLDLQEDYRSSLKPIDSFDVFIQNNQNVTIKKYTFLDVYFASVDGPEMRTTDNDSNIISTVEMRFRDWDRNRNLKI